ncbi:MAG: LamG domain-containing protein, partial [Candidatus Methanoperedens sp.]|nr:LamG domain-containing protein [Candidatus Methanoperedens sp.]
AGNNVTITAPYSIEGWVKIPANSGSANKNIISLGTTSSGYPKFSPHKGTTNKPMIYLNASNYRYGSTNLADNNWHHIAFIVTGTNAADILNAKIYVDGVEEVYGSTVRTGLPAAPSGKAWIGTNSFNGTLDEMRIHNRALNPEEIKASYDAGVYGLSRNFTNLADGAYNYRAYAQNPYGIVNQTEKRTLFISSIIPP